MGPKNAQSAGFTRPSGGLRGALTSAAVVLTTLYLAWTLLPADFVIGGGGWWMCLDYVGAGTLYSGQPYCAQGPVIYYLGYLLRLFFGDRLLIYAFWAVVLSANAVIYLILRRILTHQSLYHPQVFGILYILMVFRFMSDITSTVATCMFIAGYYLLCHARSRHGGVLAGAALALAIFTKYTTVLPAVILLVSCLAMRTLRPLHLKGVGISIRPVFQKQAILDFIWAVIAIMTSFIILRQMHPLLVKYTVAAQTDLISRDILGKMAALLGNMSLNTAATAVILATLAYCVLRGFFGRDTLIFPLMQLTLVLHGLLFVLTFGVTQVGSSYFLPVYPFLAASYMAVRAKSNRIFTLLVLVTLVFPSIYGSPITDATRQEFDKEAAKAVRAMEYGLRFIPPQKGLVLVEGYGGYSERFREYGSRIDPEKVVVIPTRESGYTVHEDPSWAPKLRDEIGISGTKSPYDGLTDKEKALQSEILAGRYSLIVVGPPSWSVSFRVLSGIAGYMNDNYCTVYVPNYQYMGVGRSYTALYFQDRGDCEKMKGDLRGYYTANFNSLCGIGENSDKIVKMVASWDGYEIPYCCGIPQTPKYSPQEKDRARLQDLILALILYLPTYWALRLFGKS
jgi:hypothetical protein